MESEIKTKTSQFGACTFGKTSPAELNAENLALNVMVSFEEALKLSLAIDECDRKLNSYNRATTDGENAALMMVIHLDKRRIRVLDGKL